ncbi:four helix bundle protein [Candidatus Parcubacteria bacterium]|jgi:four helix bundle protein|nr:four helix bundle protein [Candidatus Parcubacteria bacterium]MBT3948774.1 four helix bundle protein [Candidatus Parcubacteria bacterium]
MAKEYFKLEDLEAYKLTREYSKRSWEVYIKMNWQTKKVIGDQFIRSADSVGANLAEGYGRYHYLDKIKFYYNSRASLLEANHWVELLLERDIITKEEQNNLKNIKKDIHIKTNGLIKSQYSRKQNP